MKSGVAVALWIVAGVVTNAHHSLDGVYDSSRQVTIQGIIRQFHFVNPHPFVTIEVRSESGTIGQWRLEMDNRSELAGIGMDSDTLKSGDRVVVSGSPGRTQKQTLYIRRLERPIDGLLYEQVGSTPRIRTQPMKR